MSTFTILGAGGFIGSALVAALEQAGHRVHPVTRGVLPALLQARRNAGHVIDCIGLTGDFRVRPFDTADAHVTITARCLAALPFDSFLFLSSTRVYARAGSTDEDAALPCAPADPSDLYNLTKLAGEALCLADSRPAVRVARVSNVYSQPPSADTFLGQILQEGRTFGTVRFKQSPRSCKDYVDLAEVTRLLPAIAAGGRHRLYNVAAGVNVTHAAIANSLRRRFGWRVSFVPGAPVHRFPPIDTTRIRQEFGPPLRDHSQDLPMLVSDGQEVPCSPSMISAAG